MFTGIVEGRRPIVAVARDAGGLKIDVDLGDLADDVTIGDSIAIEGCCLTVEALEGAIARFHAGVETTGLTHLGDFAKEQQVNVERSLCLGDRLGGHLVSGHVDGVGIIVGIEPAGGQTEFIFEIEERLARGLMLKGSVAVDGCSLTIIRVDGARFAVAIIPHTLHMTSLDMKTIGDPVNIETDMIAKWIERLVEPYNSQQDG